MKKAFAILMMSAVAALGQCFSDVAWLAAIENESAGGGSCPADGSPSLSADQVNEAYRVGSTTSNRRGGQAAWTDGGTPRTICKVGFEVSFIEGSLSGKTYTAWIYTMSGGSLNVLQATSSGVAGASIVVGWNYFTFPTPFTTSASTSYAIVFGPAAADAVNYVWVTAGESANNVAITGYRDLFDDGGGPGFGGGGADSLDASIKFYWQ